MTLRTASEGISHARELERRLAELYEVIAERWPRLRDAVAPFGDYSMKCVGDVERTYYGVITDAIEGGFCFDLNPEDYPAASADLLRGGPSRAIAHAVRAEEALCRFYEDAASQSRGLMADVPRVFERIAKRRRGMLTELKAAVSKEEA